MTPPLGLIEGYYGKPWSWQDREATIAFLKPHGYGYYIYAPKADPHLRKLWRERHPQETAKALLRLASRCRRLDVRFGLGLKRQARRRTKQSGIESLLFENGARHCGQPAW